MTLPEKEKSQLIRYQLQTFKYAFNGIRIFFRSETKGMIHFTAAVAAIILGIWLKINRSEWIIVIIAIGLVFTAEIINSVVERLADLVNPNPNPKIAAIKDMSAAAVLIAAITALALGLIIFIPKIYQLIN